MFLYLTEVKVVVFTITLATSYYQFVSCPFEITYGSYGQKCLPCMSLHMLPDRICIHLYFRVFEFPASLAATIKLHVTMITD